MKKRNGIVGLAPAMALALVLAGCPDMTKDEPAGNSGAVTFVIKSEADVNAAKAKIAENGDGTETNYKAYTLDIQADVVVTEVIDFQAFNIIRLPVQYITITVIGNKKLTQSSNNACLFSITNNQKLIIDSAELTLEGSEDFARSIVDIGFDSTLELKNGALISNGCSGVEVSYGSTFIMSGGSITGNMSGNGSGVNIDSGYGLFTMSGGTISNNGGCGVYSGTVSEERVFTMTGGTIKDNRYGGVSIHGIFTMSGGTISGNRKLEYSGMGGGVCVDGTFTMENGTITDNESSEGGGVYVDGTFTMTDGTISNNRSTNGGGVYVDGSTLSGGTFTMSGGTIIANESSGSGFASGGGVYVSGGPSYEGTFTMTGGIISDNTVASTVSGYNYHAYGGGVYVDHCLFTMEDGTISGNEVTANYARGGGVYARGGTFTKTGGIIYGNNEPTESLRNTINNTPDSHGAAVYYSSYSDFYRDNTLGENDNLSTENTSSE